MRTVDDLLRGARRRIRRLSPLEAAAAQVAGALLVDVRSRERREVEGDIPGALVVERSVLEWRLDPASPHRLTEVHDHRQEVIVICSEGYSSSLAAAVLVDLGFRSAADVEGGFEAWAAAGLPVRLCQPA